ncbi:MAG: hypothetical protein AAFW64_01575 [Pseudomonadota bacterium]
MTMYTLRHAEARDVEKVFDLSRVHRDIGNADDGFLVSDYPMERYRDFYDKSYGVDPANPVVFLVAVTAEADEPVAFLVAYHSDYVHQSSHFSPMSTEHRLFLKFGETPSFFVIKQVGVGAGLVGQGLGSILYDGLFRHLSAETAKALAASEQDRRTTNEVERPPIDVFVAIMRVPENTRSSRFHESFGFVPVMSYGSEIGSGQHTQTDVCHITAQAAIMHKADQFEDNARADGLRTALESARTLYLHEDSLNWTKLSFMTQYIVAVLAAQFVLPNLEFAGSSVLFQWMLLVGHCALTVVGVYVLLSFSAKIKSGLFFMKTYKRAVLIIESKLQILMPVFYPSVSGVPLNSRTVILIRFARWIFGTLLALSFVINLYLQVEVLSVTAGVTRP